MRRTATAVAAGLAGGLAVPAAAPAQGPVPTPVTPASIATTPAPAAAPAPAPAPVVPARTDTTPAVVTTPGRVARPARTTRDREGELIERTRTRAERRREARAAARAAADATAAAAAAAPASGAGAAVPAAGGDALALPGSTSLPVSNLLLGSFRIPTFLLPIYQAAGAQHGVPWEVLAAINEVETDYGRNVAVSSAGAQGWMQFMPATWKRWGTDADRDGHRDPGSPVDAIFAAARYLDAAGYARDPRRAIFAYNHADWYVDGVLARARLLSALPTEVVSSLTGLAAGRFPVAARSHFRAASEPTAHPERADVRARAGARVVATQDGTIERLGRSRALGRYVVLRDAFGNRYTYAQLGEVAARYAVPRSGGSPRRAAPRRAVAAATAPPATPSAAGTPVRAAGATGPRALAAEPRVVDPAAVRAAPVRPGTPDPAPAAGSAAGTTPALSEQAANARAARSAGALPTARTRRRATARTATPTTAVAARARAQARALAAAVVVPAAAATPSATAAPAPTGTGTLRRPERLAALPDRTNVRAARLRASGEATPDATATSMSVTYAPADRARLGGLPRARVALRRLRVGSRVAAGTTLGRIARDGRGTGTTGHVRMLVRPGGRGAPQIDPRPILDGWRLYGAATGDRPIGSASAGSVLLRSKAELTRRVLTRRGIRLSAAGREDIRTGRIDRRVLATLAYLDAQGLHPTVSSLRSDHGLMTASGNVSEHSSGSAVDIAAIDGTPILGHQGPGSITDTVVRRLLGLQGAMRPHQVISLMAFPGSDVAFALPDHADHIHVGFRPDAAAHAASVLRPAQWRLLVRRLGRTTAPTLPAREERP